MTTDHDHHEQLSDIARALVADAPAAPDWDLVAATPLQRPGNRRWLAGAVAATVLVGVGGIVATRSGDDASRGSGSSPASSPTESTAFAINGAPTSVSTEPTYVVVAGDFLAGIAVAHCVTMEQLAAYNDWPDGLDHALDLDDVIRLPPGACDPETVSLAEPTFPTAFPIVNAPYTASTPNLNMLGETPPSFPAPVEVVQAYLGIRSGDVVQRGIVVTVGRNYDLREPDDPEPVDVVALGQPARLWEEHGGDGNVGDRVVWGDDPYVEVRGVDALRFLAMADESPFDVGVGADGAATLTVGALPGGYEVIFGPRRFFTSPAVEVAVQNERGTLEYSVWVSSDNQLMWNFIGEPLTPMDAGAAVTAWHVRGELFIQVNDDTFAHIWVSEDNVDSAMLLVTDLAQHITWVSAAEWEEHLGVELPPWMSPPTTSP